jgi:disease resistance protein RPM1
LGELDKVPQGIESLHTLKKLSLVNLHRGFLTEWNKSRMHDKMQHVLEIRV